MLGDNKNRASEAVTNGNGATTLALAWTRGSNGSLFRFADIAVEPAAAHGVAARGISGVYVLYQSGGPSWIYVGESRDIGARLAEHRADPRLQAFDGSGALMVAWAPVASLHRQGVVSYLTVTLAPTFACPVEAARPVAVNLPI